MSKPTSPKDPKAMKLKELTDGLKYHCEELIRLLTEQGDWDE